MKKILLIHSWADYMSDARQMRMQENPYLKEYEIFHIYAVKEPYNGVDKNLFFNSLKESIDYNQPDLLLIHSGVCFHQCFLEYVSVLLKIKKTYPDLKLGVERGTIDDEVLNALGLFENSIEIRNLEDLFFNIAYGLNK